MHGVRVRAALVSPRASASGNAGASVSMASPPLTELLETVRLGHSEADLAYLGLQPSRLPRVLHRAAPGPRRGDHTRSEPFPMRTRQRDLLRSVVRLHAQARRRPKLSGLLEVTEVLICSGQLRDEVRLQRDASPSSLAVGAVHRSPQIAHRLVVRTPLQRRTPRRGEVDCGLRAELLGVSTLKVEGRTRQRVLVPGHRRRLSIASATTPCSIRARWSPNSL